MTTLNPDAVLCYVEGPWAWFTTQPLDEQWGDDWDDAPFEHNAGSPYEPYGKTDHNPDGTPKWEVFRVAWSGEFEAPYEGYCNSPYSVQDINRGDVAWLRPSRFGSPAPGARPIPAGTTLAEFCRLIRAGGGTVYLPAD